MDRKRVLVAITLAETGGAQTCVAHLLPALTERYDVVVAAYGPGPLQAAAAEAGARFVPLRHVRRQIGIRDLAGLVELVRLFRRERPDLVHLNSSKVGAVGRIAAVLARVPARVFTVHGWSFNPHSGLAERAYRALERALARFAWTICVSASERAKAPWLNGRATVIPHGIDVQAISRAEPSGSTPTVISVGRLVPPKDFGTLADAFRALEPGSFRALVVGEGEQRSHLEGIAGVELLGERTDVPELLGRADVFVLSSRSEGLPVSVLEAMAAGLPVVATDVGGVPEEVVDGETGFLVPAGDATALAAAIARLVADPDLRRRLGAGGRERAETLFDLPRFRREHIALYERLLAR